MTFGTGAGGTRTNTLYFAAGINGENDGLVGAISLARTNQKSNHRGDERDEGVQDGDAGNDSNSASTPDQRKRHHASATSNGADLVLDLTAGSAQR